MLFLFQILIIRKSYGGAGLREEDWSRKDYIPPARQGVPVTEALLRTQAKGKDIGLRK